MTLKKIGGLWLKEGKNGKFMSGQIELDGDKIDLLVFKNDKGDNPKRPDYSIMLKDDDGNDPPPAHTQQPFSPAPAEDDIPF